MLPQVVETAPSSLKLTFKGFTKRHDKWYNVDDNAVVPVNSWREAGRVAVREKKRLRDEEKEAVAAANKKSKAEQPPSPVADVITVSSKSGRKIKTTVKKLPPASHAGKGVAVKTKQKEEEKVSWICTECKEIECASDADCPLLICEGSCERPFHLNCVEGLDVIPEGEWVCKDCEGGRHECVVCMEYGLDDVEGGVVKCRKGDCGLYYHESCLGLYNAEIDEKQVAANEARVQAGDDTFVPPKFTCPAHMCWTCGDLDLREHSTSAFKTKTGTLYRCMHCPNAFHVDCLTPLCNFHELAVICHDHSKTHKLPEMTQEMSVLSRDPSPKGESKRGKVGGYVPVGSDVVPVYISDKFVDGYSLPDMVVPAGSGIGIGHFAETSLDEMSFKLPLDVHDEVFSKPPSYSHINALKYVVAEEGFEGDKESLRPSKREPEDYCKCMSVEEGGQGCDEVCLNRLMHIECVGVYDQKMLKEGGRSKVHNNCMLGKECGNRRLGRKQTARCRPKREPGKGWGLITVDGCKVDDLVSEYVGEVLDTDQINARLVAHEKLKPNDPNFYIMALETGWFIDARDKGNLSRFINHSCDPNCQLQRTVVAGVTRIAIVCIRSVGTGEFLSYDYQFDTEHAASFRCACGADKCRGTMKGGNASLVEGGAGERVKKTKAAMLKEARAKNERDRVFVQKVEEESVGRLNLVGVRVPGGNSEAETVLNGPREMMQGFVRESRIALWRNVVAGYEGLLARGREEVNR